MFYGAAPKIYMFLTKFRRNLSLLFWENYDNLLTKSI